MKTHARVLWLPKGGFTEQEYQDAYFLAGGDSVSCEDPVQRFSVADGASEAIYSGMWAQMLTRSWCAGGLDLRDDRADELQLLQTAWKSALPSEELSWWAEEKMAGGAFAALAGIALHASDGGFEWDMQAIGDCCLFVSDGKGIEVVGPVKHSKDFSSSPFLLSSVRRANERLNDHLFVASGRLALNGTAPELLLMTDALAQWYLAQVEAGAAPDALFDFLDADRIAAMRESGQLRNDDVTLMSVRIVG